MSSPFSRTLQAVLKDQNENGIPNESYSFYYRPTALPGQPPASWTFEGTSITDPFGVATFTFNPGFGRFDFQSIFTDDVINGITGSSGTIGSFR